MSDAIHCDRLCRTKLTRRKEQKLFLSQGIIPRAVNDKVTELYVPKDKLAAAKEEAKTLPAVEISKLDLQWVQVLAEGWASPLTGELT